MIVLMPVLAAAVIVATPAPERAAGAAPVTAAVEAPPQDAGPSEGCYPPVRSSWH